VVGSDLLDWGSERAGRRSAANAADRGQHLLVTAVTARGLLTMHSRPLPSSSPRAEDNEDAQDHCVGLRAGGYRDHAKAQARHATRAAAPRSGNRYHAFAKAAARAGVALDASRRPLLTKDETGNRRRQSTDRLKVTPTINEAGSRQGPVALHSG
jgi:hypothetical protein